MKSNNNPHRCRMEEEVKADIVPTPTHETAEDLTAEGLNLKLEDDVR